MHIAHKLLRLKNAIHKAIAIRSHKVLDAWLKHSVKADEVKLFYDAS